MTDEEGKVAPLALLDENSDGKIDTLRVYAIRHAAALPYPHFDRE